MSTELAVKYGTSTETKSTIVTGGGSTETRMLLWGNPTPTTGRGAFDATLSESQDNYDYLEIEATYSTSTTESTIIRFPVFKSNGTEYTYTPLSTAYRNQLKGGVVIYNASSATLCRRFVQTNSTTISFTTCTQVGGTTTTNTGAMPLSIYGIKVTGGGSGSASAELVAIGNVSNTTSPYYMTIPIEQDIKSGLVIINYTRDSNQPLDSVSVTSGTAVVESGTAGKYQYTNAFLNTYAIRINNVSAGSTVTVMRTSNGANFYTYVVYKFS